MQWADAKPRLSLSLCPLSPLRLASWMGGWMASFNFTFRLNWTWKRTRRESFAYLRVIVRSGYWDYEGGEKQRETADAEEEIFRIVVVVVVVVDESMVIGWFVLSCARTTRLANRDYFLLLLLLFETLYEWTTNIASYTLTHIRSSFSQPQTHHNIE